MRTIVADVERLGGAILIVSFASPGRVAAVVAEDRLPFPMVSDTTKAAYRAFGLERGSLGTFLRPGVMARYLGKLLRGWRPRSPAKGDDLFQLGGDFVLDALGRVRYAHPSREPTDRPTAAELLGALRASS